MHEMQTTIFSGNACILKQLERAEGRETVFRMRNSDEFEAVLYANDLSMDQGLAEGRSANVVF